MSLLRQTYGQGQDACGGAWPLSTGHHMLVAVIQQLNDPSAWNITVDEALSAVTQRLVHLTWRGLDSQPGIRCL